MCTSRKRTGNWWVSCTVGVFCRDTNRDYCCRGWLAKFAAYLYAPLSDKNILYEIGDFKLNAAQIVSIFTIILLSYVNSRGVKNSKILQTVLTVIKILSLAGLIIFGFMAAKRGLGCNWTNAGRHKLNVETGSWLPIMERL
jgi:APA family basic amino acid/polyamine antiporter